MFRGAKIYKNFDMTKKSIYFFSLRLNAMHGKLGNNIFSFPAVCLRNYACMKLTPS